MQMDGFDEQRVLSAVIDGIRDVVRSFQGRPFQFSTEASLQAWTYSHIRKRLEEANCFYANLPIYRTGPYSVPHTAAILQCEPNPGKGSVFDMVVVDPRQPDLALCKPGGIRPLVAVELKLNLPEAASRRVFKEALQGKDRNGSSNNLLTDWEKLERSSATHKLALWFASVPEAFEAAEFPEICATCSRTVDELKCDHAYVITPEALVEIVPRHEVHRPL